MLTLARQNYRTSLAGFVGGLALLAGIAGTYTGGRLWPVVLGLVVKTLADLLGHVLAADARKDMS